MERAIFLASMLLMAVWPAVCQADCAPRPPPVVNRTDTPDEEGKLFLIEQDGFRALADGCYVYPELFNRSRISFNEQYLPESSSPDGVSVTDFFASKALRIIDDPPNPNLLKLPNLIKVFRNPGWTRPGGQKPLAELPDTAVDADTAGWNAVHTMSPRANLSDYDTALGVAWHAQADDDDGLNSYGHPALWLLPPDRENLRTIVSNQLIRFTSGSNSTPTTIPFNVNLYAHTRQLVLSFFFGRDGDLHTITFCSSAAC